MSKTLVFGHRGACGYRPENTLESFELAFVQGSDAIETDLVPTKDGRVILRHENALSKTTDVALHENFKARFRKGWADGHRIKDWFSEDFTLEEISQLRATERLPDLRPGSAKFDGVFGIATVADLLNAEFAIGKTLILELKHGAHFEELGLNLPQLLVAELARVDWKARGNKLIIESFDWHCLLEAKRLLGDSAKYVFLSDHWRLAHGGYSASHHILDEYLADVAEKFDGISVDFGTLFEPRDEKDPNAQFGEQTHFAKLAKKHGLMVFGYTARVEEAVNSVEEYYHHIVSTGVDAVFADQPDLLQNFLGGLA